MAYTSNIFVGKTRRLAVNDVRFGRRTQAEAARYYGVHRATIHKWIKRASADYREFIRTKSSRPKSSSKQLPKATVNQVIQLRKQTGRCAEVLHILLNRKAVQISLSSVERTLQREQLTKKKKRVKPSYAKLRRPLPSSPGILLEIDTIYFLKENGSRFFIYAVIDLYSRAAYAEYSKVINTRASTIAIRNATRYFGFPIKLIQSDNGQEFGEELYFSLKQEGIKLRHTRVRRPNDNAHIERFNRTIQEECFGSSFPDERTIVKKLQKYIDHYNKERPHLGLDCKTPFEMLRMLPSS